MKKTLAIMAVITFACAGCVTLQKNKLYESSGSNRPETFFASSAIFEDFITSEMWFTNNEQCVTVESKPYAAESGSSGLHVKWDKNNGICEWIGVGIGWDNWTGKDLGTIKNNAALQFKARMKDGERGMLPWALAFEDFTGSQAWLGMNESAITDQKFTTDWTTVTLPLSEFDWLDQGANASNIKQLIIQLEADGEVYLDDIKIVPYTGGYRQRAIVKHVPTTQIQLDGNLNETWTATTTLIGANSMRIATVGNQLYIAGEVSDKSPLMNNFSAEQMNRGDCLELVFSTSYTVNPKRAYFTSTDHHIGIQLGGEHHVWDYQAKKLLQLTSVKTSTTSTGYAFEALIDLSELSGQRFSIGQLYDFDMSLSNGSNTSDDPMRLIWNAPNYQQFNENPASWGELYMQSTPLETP